MKIRIASWNVNSVRLRERALHRFVGKHAPHVLCLQETKVSDEHFPCDGFRALGYTDLAFHGQKGYNGVAIVSNLPFLRVRSKRWCGRMDCRHITVTLPGGVEVHNFYVPAGGDIPDPERNEKFAYKLQFLTDVTRWFRRRRKPSNRFILAGDLNVAPHENDVWSHERLSKVVTHTPVEIQAMERLRRSHDWIDAVRYFVPTSRKLYSWWSYRAPEWRRVNKGRRLDHIWVTPALESSLVAADTARETRGWKTPSDHVPVVVSLDLPAL